MITLDEDVVFGGEVTALGRAGGAVDGDVFLDEFSVEVDGEEEGLFEELAIGIEAGSSEFDDDRLPFSSGLGGVDERGVAFVAMGSAFVIPTVVDGAHVSVGDFGFAMRVEDLNFVTSLEIDTGVGALGDHEFGFDGAVSELIDGVKVAGLYGVGGVGVKDGFGTRLDLDLITLGICHRGFLPTREGFEDFLPGGGLGCEGKRKEEW